MKHKLSAPAQRPFHLLLLLGCLIQLFAADTSRGEHHPGPHDFDENLRVYHIGNSLTRNIPLQRLEQLVKADGGSYDYGMQLGGGHRLEQHLVKRNHGNAPGEGRHNNHGPYGDYDQAFKQHTFDAVILQPYKGDLDQPHETQGRWPYHNSGALQAADALIDYARGQTEAAAGRWDLEHPNDHQACDRFYIYATWPGVDEVLEAGGFAEYWAQPYEGGIKHCADYFEQLVAGLNQRHSDLETPIRLIPVGDVLAALDQRIRAGDLPGIADFYQRNQPYYVESRRNNKHRPAFDPDGFQPAAGVLYFYADGIHMNDQPHNTKDSGAIGSYVAALTHFAVLTGHSPVGLTAAPYEQFDDDRDAALIRALQETVWTVVTAHPLTGVAAPGP